MNAEEADDLARGCDTMWMHLTPLYCTLRQLLRQEFPGLPYELMFSAKGSGLLRKTPSGKGTVWVPLNAVFSKLYEKEVLHRKTDDVEADCPPWKLEVIFPFQNGECLVSVSRMRVARAVRCEIKGEKFWICSFRTSCSFA